MNPWPEFFLIVGLGIAGLAIIIFGLVIIGIVMGKV